MGLFAAFVASAMAVSPEGDHVRLPVAFPGKEWARSSRPAPTDPNQHAKIVPATNLPPINKPASPTPVTPSHIRRTLPARSINGLYPWKREIVTTVFWIGERAAQNNPVPNNKSSWDGQWQYNYGGVDCPENRIGFRPKHFEPRQNPFYVALPYNDVNRAGTKPEAAIVIPWFRQTFQKSGQSVCKGRWVAVRKGTKVAYAQWEDVGPFTTDHWEYVFGQERPRPNRNQSAGLDVSPAVRDYLGLKGKDVTDWRFVEAWEVPDGPWRKWGDNNIFALAEKQTETTNGR